MYRIIFKIMNIPFKAVCMQWFKNWSFKFACAEFILSLTLIVLRALGDALWLSWMHLLVGKCGHVGHFSLYSHEPAQHRKVSVKRAAWLFLKISYFTKILHGTQNWLDSFGFNSSKNLPKTGYVTQFFGGRYYDIFKKATLFWDAMWRH